MEFVHAGSYISGHHLPRRSLGVAGRTLEILVFRICRLVVSFLLKHLYFNLNIIFSF